MSIVKLAIAGMGNIGQQSIDTILSIQEQYQQKHGVQLRVVGVCNSSQGRVNPDGLKASDCVDRTTFVTGLTGKKFIEQVEADILIEAGPTHYNSGEPGLSYARYAINKGMHVIFTSKGAMLLHGANLQRQALHRGVALKCRCATASGLPAMDLLQHSYANSTIYRIDGILTGTTSFILDQMQHSHLTLEQALDRAQTLGLSEPDPTHDISGQDTACKLMIIANSLFDCALSMQDSSISGIESVTLSQIKEWADNGLTPKLVGTVTNQNGYIEMNVGLKLLDAGDSLSQVDARQKALRIYTEEFGEALLSGGASSPGATTSALLEDLTQIVKQYYRA